LPLEAELPGPHASIWRFRQTIEKQGLSAALFGDEPAARRARPHRQRGTLVDATLIAASVKHPAYGAGERAEPH
jgi:hypothetical protein